jgi:hypothetical protein
MREITPHFDRHPLNVPADFYVENGCCMSCGVPESIAPGLIGETGKGIWHGYWKKQPKTDEEIKQAIHILHAQELGGHRYAGSDPKILKRLPRECCDAFSGPPPTPKANLVSGGEVRFESLDEQDSLPGRLWKPIFRK